MRPLGPSQPPIGYDLWFRLKQLDLAMAVLQAALLPPAPAPVAARAASEEWLVAYA